ncbi:hypothetical protein FGM00_16565 [Aggregatimonas sangjinii]|uniref:Uncharacterized protein n=1 Tax=Aggregatimonas sangjinii TaxID=2583587 RepID=A0A5B7SS89_9FLAO|nr:hypothetical protein [Aggregatimonas sangjinii]QCX01645.1 hypothetical protein FGM00_16565 [Aggregatimonas sangjinii]
MKYIITAIVIVSLGLIGYGFSLEASQEALADKFIGLGTLGLFLLAMPLFLYKESKHRKMKDYMLNEENVRRMRGEAIEKPENQEGQGK